MNHSELVDGFAEKTGQSKSAAKTNLEALFGLIGDAIASGDEVKVNNFGAFGVKESAARKGRNPATGQEIDIPARKGPSFKASKVLKDRLNG